MFTKKKKEVVEFTSFVGEFGKHNDFIVCFAFSAAFSDWLFHPCESFTVWPFLRNYGINEPKSSSNHNHLILTVDTLPQITAKI